LKFAHFQICTAGDRLPTPLRSYRRRKRWSAFIEECVAVNEANAREIEKPSGAALAFICEIILIIRRCLSASN
jgi:hypothetical protein